MPEHHPHAHGHAHGHDHDHGAATEANARRIFWVMCITAGFMVVEAGGGLIAGSLALLADAGHMLTDAAALGLAWFAFRLGRRPADPQRSFGYDRAQVLAAFVNGTVLIAVVLGIAVEAARRLMSPIAVDGTTMLTVGALGLVVNVVAFALLRGEENLNVRSAALHVLGDLLGSGAAVAAAIVIILTGWMPIDPILSIVVGALVLRSAWAIIRRSGHILLEGTPDWLDVGALRGALAEAVPDVVDIHHVHVWSLTSERPLITLHATVAPGADRDAVMGAVHDFLVKRYGIGHTTIQVEQGACLDEATTAAGH